jgi:hypothetical protein
VVLRQFKVELPSLYMSSVIVIYGSYVELFVPFCKFFFFGPILFYLFGIWVALGIAQLCVLQDNAAPPCYL